jgi:hypothetical protein
VAFGAKSEESSWAEGSGGNAGASRREFAGNGEFILERSALGENIRIFVGHPISFCESGFVFWANDELARQIRAADYGLADFRDGPVQFPVRVLPFG